MAVKQRIKPLWLVGIIGILVGVLGLLWIRQKMEGEGFQTQSNHSPLGFYILRHMNTPESMEYWWTSYTHIRALYPTEPIVIVDDNSKSEFSQHPTNVSREAQLVEARVESYPEYPGRGELLPYYAFYKRHPFDKAVILHDSTFLKKRLPVEDVKDVRFVWHFDDHQWDNPGNEKRIIGTLNPNVVFKVQRLHGDKKKWMGCFGVQSVMTYSALKQVQERYGLFNALSAIHTRPMRMALERIFSVLCTLEFPTLSQSPSLLGCIHRVHPRAFGYGYADFIRDRDAGTEPDIPVIKIWSGR